MFNIRLIISLAVIAGSLAQQPGKQKDNKQPPLSFDLCDSSGSCNTQQGGAVLDSNWMWTHKVGTYTNCFTGNSWDSSLCPDPVTCAKNCALDGGDYESTYGVSTSGNAISLKFVTKTSSGTNVGSRTYLTAPGGDEYQMFKLKNREFQFTVDDSTLGCGLNGALYFVEMDADGGLSKYSGNNAGAKYGTGYCDAQCPHDIKFINGEANVLDWISSPSDPNSGTGKYGTCCVEMDIWESNKISQAITPHPCVPTVMGQTRCNGTTCGDDSKNQRYQGYCDKDGGDWAPYRLGDHTFWGPGSSFTVDSTQPVTVVTQFHTVDGTDTGDLSEITRFYMQNGKRINESTVTINDKSYSGITDDFVSAQKTLFGDPNSFQPRGGLKVVGEALERGMVLVMSLWADDAVHMLWLDSDFPTSKPSSTPGVARGSCSTSSGVPSSVIANQPDATVKYSNIKFGPIGSTTGGGPSPSGCPGGSLQACINLCPSTPAAAYKACVDSCVSRCS